MLLLSGSRSAFLGVAVALAVYLVFTSSPLLARFGKSIRILLITLAAAPMVAIALSQDPTLNGRTPIWPHYWEFWLSSPITGVGTSNINQLLQNGTLHLSNVHAHDLGLDLLGRYGLVGFVMALLTLALAAVITWRGAKSGAPFGLAIVLAFLAIGLVEVHGSWMYWSVPSAWLLLAVLWGWNVAVSSGRSTVTH
jgi:O-antigen ligase